MSPPLSIFAAPRLLIIFLCTLLLAAAPAAETPRRGGTLQLIFLSDWRTLDPAIGFDASSAPLQKLLFRGLLNYDDGINLLPDQASDWNISPDGKTYTFHLRPGARFAHGREVEAEDYVFSLERVLDTRTRSPGQSYFLDIAGAREFAAGKAEHVSGLRAPDARTLVIELAKPAFTFRYVLAMPFASALPREVVRQYGADFQYHLVGSGPYRVTEWQRERHWRFERNPHFSGPGDGWVDAVDIMIGGDRPLAAMLVERGEVHRAEVDAVTALRFSRDPKLKSWLHLVSPVNVDYLFLNVEMKPFDDVRVRRAMNYAVDKRRLVKIAIKLAVAADGIVPPSMPWTNPDLPKYEYSPEKARALLREAGLPDGFKTKLYYIRTLTLHRLMAQSIQQDLQAIGVEAELRDLSSSAFEVFGRTRHQAPCGIWGWLQDYPDPSNFIDTLLGGDRITDEDCNNLSFYSNSEVNRRVIAARELQDPAERLRLFREAETIAMQDAPWVPLTASQYAIVCHPRLHGDVPHPVWNWRYENMWLEP